MAKAMEFRPAKPPRRALVRIAFLAVLFAMIAPRILARGAPMELVGLAIGALLVIGGLWIALRLRLRGSPVLRVDRDGLCYSRLGREQRARWADVTAIEVDFQRKEMHFLRDGEPKIVTHIDMVAADGQRFDMLIEKYWKKPKGAARPACG